jgi:tetratricopeptide (TPR) repeat protein
MIKLDYRPLWQKCFIVLFISSFVLSIGISCSGISNFLNKLQLGHGELLADEQHYEEAIQEFNKVINDPSITNIAYSDRAMAYYNLGDYKKALEDCTIIITNDSKSWYPYYLKAHISRKLGNYEEALDSINTAINYANDISAMVYSTRAMIYYDLNKYLDALNDCDKSLKIDSSDFLAYKVRGTIFLQAGQINPSELEKALFDFNKAISIDSKDTEVYYNRALVYIAQMKYHEGFMDLERALDLAQDPSDILMISKKMSEIQQLEGIK